jgi:enoyl-CoA hydratase/carnithine racemase
MPDQTEPKLLIERLGPVTYLTLNRPQVHNALDRELSLLLNEAVRSVERDRECAVLVLRGAGDTFCAGDDITEFNTWSGDDPYWQVRLYQETAKLIEDLTCITIAQVDGVATGGGLELTLVSDFVVATDRSRWGMPEIDWDITPGWGGTTRLTRFAGKRKTKEWNLIGALFDAQTAERYDLINRITTPENLVSEVDALIEVILAKDPFTLRRTKKYLNVGSEIHISGALAFEAEATPRELGQGVADFTSRPARAQRRKLSKNFWQN